MERIPEKHWYAISENQERMIPNMLGITALVHDAHTTRIGLQPLKALFWVYILQNLWLISQLWLKFWGTISGICGSPICSVWFGDISPVQWWWWMIGPPMKRDVKPRPTPHEARSNRTVESTFDITSSSSPSFSVVGSGGHASLGSHLRQAALSPQVEQRSEGHALAAQPSDHSYQAGPLFFLRNHLRPFIWWWTDPRMLGEQH